MFESWLDRSGRAHQRNARKDKVSTKVKCKRVRDSLNTKFEGILQQRPQPTRVQRNLGDRTVDFVIERFCKGFWTW